MRVHRRVLSCVSACVGVRVRIREPRPQLSPGSASKKVLSKRKHLENKNTTVISKKRFSHFPWEPGCSE